MSRLLILAVLVACIAAVPIRSLTSSDEEVAQFSTFKRQYKKAYFDQHDEEYRKNIFIQNLRKIRSHNEAKSHKYTLAMNSFGDMTFEEFHSSHTGFLGVRHQYLRSRNIADLSHVQVADSVDWQTAGAVTPVKNQGQCGSCWAFSSTGSIEGAWFIAKNQLVSLSEQQLMDCSKSQGDNSCEGGLMDYAFEYVISNGGLCTEDSYPYKEADEDNCNSKSCTFGASISAYSDVGTSEDALKAAVTQQPVSVAIEADQEAFQFYSSGVLTGTCGTQLDHGVLAVGYGTLDGTDYWKVKNSWGGDWGLNGFVLIERGSDECGIHDAASFPTI
jgi:cathepsin L